MKVEKFKSESSSSARGASRDPMKMLEKAKLVKHNLSSAVNFADLAKTHPQMCIGVLFTAMWCRNSRTFMPFLEKVYKSAQDKQFVVIMASFDHTQAQFEVRRLRRDDAV